MRIHEKYNLTPFVTGFHPCMDERGADYVVAVLKTTFMFSENGKVSVAEKKSMLPVFCQDVLYEDNKCPSVCYSSDIVPKKQGTDIIINGHAYGRGKQKVTVRFVIGSLEKEICVFGPRNWQSGTLFSGITKPQAFDQVPMRYEYAFGGSDKDENDELQTYPYNPTGVGFLTRLREGSPAPNLEDPKKPIKSIKDRPLPAGFGPIPTNWSQRARFAGTFEDDWSENQRPLFPSDFDERFYNSVPEDQVHTPKLQGGETILLENMHSRQNIIQVKIPHLKFSTTFRVKDRSDTVPMVIDALVVEPDKNRFALTFRSSLVIGQDWHFLKSVHFEPQAAIGTK
jgi:hypothetical protein